MLVYKFPQWRKVPLIAALSAVFCIGVAVPNVTLAAGCPSVADPQGIKTEQPFQLDLSDYEKQIGKKMTLTDNPIFAEQVKAGKLPPIAERVPEDALVYLPYVDCGKYGGTLRGFARAYESGTSEILSWRQLNMVRYSDDMKTVVPNVAKSWKWNDDYTEIIFDLRKGHKWSDGKAFTADDVTFWANDIINNKEIHKETPFPWTIGMRAEKIDETTVKMKRQRAFAIGHPPRRYGCGRNKTRSTIDNCEVTDDVSSTRRV